MKQTTESSGGVISEMAFGAITGIAFVRKLIFLTIKLVAITTAMGALMVVVILRDYFPSKPAPVVQEAPLAPEPRKNRQSKPPPNKRDDVEELRRLARPNPL